MELYFYYLAMFVSGLFIGSFLNVVADRLINGESIVFGRSHCDTCQAPLTPLNLIPLFSFVFQKGKCSNCGTHLSFFYPIAEVMTGALFVLAVYLAKTFLGPLTLTSVTDLIFLLAIFSLYMILFLTDAKYQLIPDIIVIIGVVVSLGYTIFSSAYGILAMRANLLNDDFGKYLIKAGYLNMQIINASIYLGWIVGSALLIALFFYLLVVLTKERGMGKGDIGLGLLIGLFNGFPYNILAVFLGFLLGALVSLVLIFFGKKTMKDNIAFGPFLLGGSLVALIWGTQILTQYLHVF